MGAFHSSTTIKRDHSVMRPIANAIANEFLNEDFNVKTDSTVSGGYVVSITKGNLFQSILGLKTALTVMVVPVSSGIKVDASVGIFGQQVIPTIITLFYLWPVLLTQVWGMVKQAKLDDKAIMIACETARKIPMAKRYCTYCGKEVHPSVTVCPHCKSHLR